MPDRQSCKFYTDDASKWSQSVLLDWFLYHGQMRLMGADLVSLLHLQRVVFPPTGKNQYTWILFVSESKTFLIDCLIQIKYASNACEASFHNSEIFLVISVIFSVGSLSRTSERLALQNSIQALFGLLGAFSSFSRIV